MAPGTATSEWEPKFRTYLFQAVMTSFVMHDFAEIRHPAALFNQAETEVTVGDAARPVI